MALSAYVLQTPWHRLDPLISLIAYASLGSLVLMHVCSVLRTLCALEVMSSSPAPRTQSLLCRVSIPPPATVTGDMKALIIPRALPARPIPGAGLVFSTHVLPTLCLLPCPTTSETVCAVLASLGQMARPAVRVALGRSVQWEAVLIAWFVQMGAIVLWHQHRPLHVLLVPQQWLLDPLIHPSVCAVQGILVPNAIHVSELHIAWEEAAPPFNVPMVGIP